MRQNTLITLGASLAFGVLAVFLARGWIDDAIEMEYQNVALPKQSVKQAAVPVIQTEPVIVFDVDVEFGDVLTPELVRVVDYPADAVPMGSYSSINDMFVDMNKRTVALAAMARNELVMDHRISGPGARGTMSALVTPGMRAVSIRVDDMAGVAGFVMPGDHVDIIYRRDPSGERDTVNLVADILLQNVKVLGIDQNLNAQSSDPDLVRTVTLEVDTKQAQILHIAGDSGDLSLTLRAAGDKLVGETVTVTQKSLVRKRAAKAVKPKRRAPKPISKPVPAEGDKVAQVTIIRGETRNQVNVLSENNTDEKTSDADTLAGG